MPKSSPRSFEHAFTLIELLVVTGIIVILLALAVPVFTGVIDRAKATKDMSNLRQIGLGNANIPQRQGPDSSRHGHITGYGSLAGALPNLHCNQKSFPIAVR